MTEQNVRVDNEEMARRIRVLRAERNWGVVEAAENLGISTNTLRTAESGERTPYYPTLVKIASGYGVPLSSLLPDLATGAKMHSEMLIFAAYYDSSVSRDEAWKQASEEARSFKGTQEGWTSIRDTGERVEVYARPKQSFERGEG
jgi:transcriptional regulator with XRE-family HTH domain